MYLLSCLAFWTTFATPLTLALAAALRHLACTAARQLQLISDDEEHDMLPAQNQAPAQTIGAAANVVHNSFKLTVTAV